MLYDCRKHENLFDASPKSVPRQQAYPQHRLGLGRFQGWDVGVYLNPEELI